MTRGEEVEAAAQAIANGAEVVAARADRMTVVVLVIAEATGETVRVAAGCAIRASLPKDIVLSSMLAMVDHLDDRAACDCPDCRRAPDGSVH